MTRHLARVTAGPWPLPRTARRRLRAWLDPRSAGRRLAALWRVPPLTGLVVVSVLVFALLPWAAHGHWPPTAVLLVSALSLVSALIATALGYRGYRRASREQEQARWALVETLGWERRSRSRFATAEARFRGVVISAPDPILLTNGAGTITFASQRACELFGLDYCQLIGRPISKLFKDGATALAYLLRRTAWAADEVPRRVECTARRGPFEFAAEVSISGVESENGLMLACVVRDLSLRQEVEARRLAERAAEARLEGVTLAAREVAHQLNNALALPAGYLEIIQQRTDPASELRPMIDEALRGLDVAAEQIRLLQRVVRLEIKQTATGPALDLERSAEARLA